jgi:glutamate racemase
MSDEKQGSETKSSRPVIGVFDSGFGGLTVLKALIQRIPSANFVFLGDTARLPYGSKSRRTIARYAAESAQFLVNAQKAEFLVIACNTASALALDAIEEAVDVPVLGVIEPGAAAAALHSKSRDVMVIATEATVHSHAYAEACRRRGLHGVEKACPLLVPLVEEGWIDPAEHPVTAEVVRIYLAALLEEARHAGQSPDTLVLGCTHYPLLRPIFEKAVPAGVQVIDSAEATAEEAARRGRKAGPDRMRPPLIRRAFAALLPIRWRNLSGWDRDFLGCRWARSSWSI